MSSIVIAGNTSGTITVSAPDVSGTNTITLPASTGTAALLQTPSFATTIGVGGATPAASGAGITFPATKSPSSDANTLDDYEEGTWTPTLRNATTTTYTTQNARYTKIGRVVYIQLNLRINSVGNGNTTQIAGLPFTTQGISNNEACVAIANFDQIATNIVSIYGGIFDTFINITSLTAAGSTLPSNAIFKNSAIIELGGWYLAAT
jgi:hypothetical protein